MKPYEEKYLKMAIALSEENAGKGGGPFGAVISRGEELISRGVNLVTSLNDPTSHAEIVAIREACRQQGTFDLSGYTIYASCEPCPMCLSAIYWARITKLVFAAEKKDAALAGFDDEFIYRELLREPGSRKLVIEKGCRKESLRAFSTWLDNPEKKIY